MTGHPLLDGDRTSAPGTAPRISSTTCRLEVGRGEVVALMGRNGAGKSTTMKAIMGLIGSAGGTVAFQRPRHFPAEAVRDRAARPRLHAGGPPHLLRSHGAGKSRHRPPAATQLPDGRPAPAWTPDALFALFPNLGEMPDRPGGRMSGGEQQMLTVARTLMGNPLLVLLDEPSEGVAPLIVEQMANTIVEAEKEGLSILLSEQNVHFAELVSDRVLRAGEGPDPLARHHARARRQHRNPAQLI